MGWGGGGGERKWRGVERIAGWTGRRHSPPETGSAPMPAGAAAAAAPLDHHAPMPWALPAARAVAEEEGECFIGSGGAAGAQKL